MSGLTKVRDNVNDKNVYLSVNGSGELPMSVSSLPLPSGAATSALQSTANSELASIKTAVEGTLAVSASSLPLPSGAATSALQTTANTALAAIETAVEGTLAVSAASLPLPSGAATSALQSTANTALAAIETAVEGTLTVTEGITRAASTLKSSASVTAGDKTSSIDMSDYKKIAIYGESSDNGQSLRVMVSDDDITYYDSDTQIYANGSNGHLYGVFEAVTKYVKLKYGSTATETTKVTKFK